MFFYVGASRLQCLLGKKYLMSPHAVIAVEGKQ